MEQPTRTPSQQSMQIIPGISAVRKLFKSHGEFCASQPWGSDRGNINVSSMFINHH